MRSWDEASFEIEPIRVMRAFGAHSACYEHDRLRFEDNRRSLTWACIAYLALCEIAAEYRICFASL